MVRFGEVAVYADLIQKMATVLEKLAGVRLTNGGPWDEGRLLES